MTEDQEAAVFKSFAEELSRAVHARLTFDCDEDEAIANIVRSLHALCSHHLEGLWRLTEALLELQAQDKRNYKQREERTVQ